MAETNLVRRSSQLLLVVACTSCGFVKVETVGSRAPSKNASSAAESSKPASRTAADSPPPTTDAARTTAADASSPPLAPSSVSTAAQKELKGSCNVKRAATCRELFSEVHEDDGERRRLDQDIELCKQAQGVWSVGAKCPEEGRFASCMPKPSGQGGVTRYALYTYARVELERAREFCVNVIEGTFTVATPR